MKALFFVSAPLVVYTYAGYPLVPWILTRLRPRDARKGSIEPSVSIIIAARNDADRIRRKIEHTLTLDYPPASLEILVASDASDDGTDEIVGEYTGRAVPLVRAPLRRGKKNAQGLALAPAAGEIIVMTDSATILELDPLRRLVENFADPSIGAVSSEDFLVDGNPTAEGVYVKFEMWVRRLESRFHSIVGLGGSCFAIRRELCVYWHATLASDFLSALHAARASYRAIADPSPPGSVRRGRLDAGGDAAQGSDLPGGRHRADGQPGSAELAALRSLRVPVGEPQVSAVPGAHPPGDNAAFAGQAAFYLVAYASGIVPRLRQQRLVRVAHFFTMVHVAMLMALVKYAMGQNQVTWEPPRHPAITPGIPPSS